VCSSDLVHHGISRNVKHISVIDRISANGESLIPYITTSQDSPLVREQLKKHVFLPNLAELRRLDEFAEEMAVLLLDNCPSHVTCVVM
jgi:phosphoglycerol transferase MdoB-like AlkP superfamily enzyme